MKSKNGSKLLLIVLSKDLLTDILFIKIGSKKNQRGK